MPLGPLTTSFTPPPDCVASSALYWVNTASTFYWLHGRPGQSSCFPDGYSPYQNQYYSPGICPAGYTRACESISTEEDTVVATRATCCPPGNYECAPTSSSYSYPWGPTLGCMSVYRVDTEMAFTTIEGTLQGGEEAGPLTSIFAPGTIMAYGVVIQNSPATTTAGETATPVPSSSADSSAPASETSPSASTTAGAQPDSNGGTRLSAGAAAGIGIGAAFAVLALGAAVLWMFWSRRRKTRQEAAELQAQSSMMSPGNWSSTTWGAPPFSQPPVMQTNWPPSELANEHGYKEMPPESRILIEADGREVYQR